MRVPVFPGYIRDYYSTMGEKKVTVERAKKKILRDIDKLAKKYPKSLYSLEFMINAVKGALEASEVNRDPLEAIYNLIGFIIPIARMNPIERWEPEYINKFRDIIDLLMNYNPSEDNPYSEIGVFLGFVHSGLELHKKYGNYFESCRDLDKRIINVYSSFPKTSIEEIIDKSTNLILACYVESRKI